jgi:hypothetical protein
MEDVSSTLGASTGATGIAATDPGYDELMRMADDLLEQAAAVRHECDELIGVLDAAAGELEADAGPPAAPAPVARRARPAEQSVYSDLPEGVVPDPSVAALGMALDGSDRETTREFLVSTFGIDDPEPILDEVYPEVERGRGKRLFRRR